MPRYQTATVMVSAANALLLELDNRSAIERLVVNDAKDRFSDLLETAPDRGNSSPDFLFDVSGMDTVEGFGKGHQVFRLSVPVDMDKLDSENYRNYLTDAIGVRTKSVLTTWWAGADSWSQYIRSTTMPTAAAVDD